MSVLIGCIGNIFQGDDGFGCEVAKVLAGAALGENIRLIDFGIRGLDLTYALLDAPELTILVDTVARGGEPGTVYTIEPQIEAAGATAAVDAHCMDPLRALRAAHAMGGTRGRILLVGCEPADFGGEEGRLGLTPTVRRAVPRAATLVLRLAYEHSQT